MTQDQAYQIVESVYRFVLSHTQNAGQRKALSDKRFSLPSDNATGFYLSVSSCLEFRFAKNGEEWLLAQEDGNGVTVGNVAEISDGYHCGCLNNTYLLLSDGFDIVSIVDNHLK